MSGRLYCGFLQPTKFFTCATRGPSLGKESHSASINRANAVAKKTIHSMQILSFEEFKTKKMVSFEEFKKSPEIKNLYKNNQETIKRVYEDSCVIKYNRYKMEQYGGNPVTMI